MMRLFITQINTKAGQEYIASGLAATMQSLGFQSCIYKPIDIGAIERNGFIQSVNSVHIKKLDPYIKTASTYMFKEKISPYIAAESERLRIDINFIKKDFDNISKDIDCLITLGTQGILTPIDIGYTEIDLVKFLDLPILVVTKPCPDAVNQTLLTVNTIEEKGLTVRGVIINDDIEYRNELKHLPRLIEEYSNAKILGIVQNSDEINDDAGELITNILNGIDIESVFDVKIAKLNV